MASLGLNDVSSGGVTMPEWYQQLAANLANGVNNAATAAGNLSSNWYNQPVAAPTTALQQQAAGQAANMQAPDAGFGQAQNALNQYQTAQNYDPNSINSYLNPYTQGQMNALANQSQTNLQQFTLPAVNTSFTGNGQFGSTRNGNFLNQAIYQNNQALTNSQAGLLNTDYQNAVNQYNQMNQNTLNKSTAQQSLSQGQQQADWLDANNKYNMGQQLQNSTQNQLNNNYQNWLNEQQIPQNQLGALAGTLPNLSTLYSKTPTSGANTQTPLTSVGGAGGLGQIGNALGTLLGQ